MSMVMELESAEDEKIPLIDQLFDHFREDVLFSGREFLPHGVASQLVTDKVILEELALDDEEPRAPLLLKFIRERAKLVFLTAIMLELKPKELLKVMKTFQDNEFDDDRLPVGYSESVTPFAGQLWSARRKRAFAENQWRFLVPVFAKGRSSKRYPNEQILPFIWKDSPISAVSSYVFKAKIHKYHYRDASLNVS
jgi:hypothetical protein